MISKKGTFEYETIYSVPIGATEFNSEGDVSGEKWFLMLEQKYY